MEVVLRDLGSSETPIRLIAIEKVAQKLENKNWLRDVAGDLRMKVMSACVNYVKDANPKIVSIALGCLNLLILNYRDDFQPLVNMSFEILLVKLGDAKVSVREQALDVTTHLVELLGVAATFERIMNNITTKNQRLKENLLCLVARMQASHGNEIKEAVSASVMCSTLSSVLNDPQSSLRQLAVTTLANLYPVYGEDLVNALSACEMRAAQQKALLEAIYEQRQRFQPGSISSTCSTGTGSLHKGASTKPSGLASTMTAASKPIKAAPVRSLSATKRRPTLSATALGSAGAAELPNFHATGNSLGSATSNASSTVSNADSAGGEGGDNNKPSSAFDPAGFMNFIQLKNSTKPTEIVDEKDLQRLFGKISTDLAKKSDWEARASALIALQKLAWGNLSEFKIAVDHIKSIHELISAQIIDLRSAVSKEACRAVGALAASLLQQFSPLTELFWPHLARVVVVKIQVIASAADKCLRVLVAACPDHRLLGLIVESCTGKNPPLRKLCLEYACLACAAWRSEGIERQIAQLKQVVRTAIADSDAGARKTARQLFWVLHDVSPTAQGQMKAMLHDLEPASQRYIQAEAAANTVELNDLLCIRQNPSCLMELAHRSAVSNLTAVHKEGRDVQKGEMNSIPMPPRKAREVETACAPTVHALPTPAPQEEEGMISEFDCLMQEEDSTSSAPSWNPTPTGTALKSSRRLSLTTGPQRIIHNQQQQSNQSHVVEGHPATDPRSSLSSMLGTTSRRMSLTGASRTLSKAESDPSQRRYEDKEESAMIHNAVPQFGSGSDRATQFATQTPAPKTATRSSLMGLTTNRATMPSTEEEGSFANHDATNAMQGLALSATGFSTAAKGSRRATLGSTLSTSDAPTNSIVTTSALANGPKRIVRPAASIPTENIPHATVPSLPQPSGGTMFDPIPNNYSKEVIDAPVFIFSVETLRTMLEDNQWSIKTKALESMHTRLQRASDSEEVLSDDLVASFVDLVLPVLGDPHHKVATDALQVLQYCVASFPKQATSRVGPTTLALFHRLADRRQAVREVANSVLNLVRTNIDSPILMAALSPRMGEVPDRMKTALMQFMGAIAPHCEEYFSQGNHAWAFLSRLAGVIGGGNVKPSATLTVAARRLLELVYRAAPIVVCSQIAALPFQQQILLKKFLEASVPDIESQVMAASRADWTSKSVVPNHNVVSSNSNNQSSSESMLAATHSLAESYVEEEEITHTQEQAEKGEEVVASDSFLSDSIVLPPETAVKVTPSKMPVNISLTNNIAISEVVTPGTPLNSTPPPPVSPALRLSSKQKLSSTRHPDSATDLCPASPSDVSLVPVCANPFSSPPPPPTETPPSIRPRQMSPAAMDLEVRVLEYMESVRHSRSPSENVSPNSPADYAPTAVLALPSGSPSRSGSKKSLSSSSSALLSATPHQSVASPLYANHNEVIANAVLASKIAIDKATEEIIERYSPSKARSPIKPSLSPELSKDTSTSSSLQNALMTAYGLSYSSTTATVETPSRPSMLPQRSRANSINNANSNVMSPKNSVSPMEAADHNTVELAQAHGSPTKSSRTPNTPISSSKKTIATTPCSAASRSPHPMPTAPKVASYTPPQQGLSVPQDSKAPSTGSKARDTQWLLENLKPTGALIQREDAHKELKHRVKTADDVYWLQNYAQIVTVLLESLRPAASIPIARAGVPSSPSPSPSLVGFEHAEMSTKALLVLSRYRGNHLKNLMEILVDRLCYAASFCPLPITQSFEIILSEFAKYDAPRLVRALLPYSSCALAGAKTEVTVGENAQVRLTALRVICNSIRFFASAQLLSQLSTLIPTVLTSINSHLADLRKAVVFILVEVYLSVGDSVFPHIHSLTPPQRKLMTIYVEKRMNERKHVVAAALT